ncbi:MAG: type II secretion system protein [Pseudomonadota bacterium]
MGHGQGGALSARPKAGAARRRRPRNTIPAIHADDPASRASIASAPARGFTLIELLIATACVGLLAAAALPRFADLRKEARVAKLNSGLAHLKALSAGGVPASVNMEGVAVTLAHLYPTAMPAASWRPPASTPPRASPQRAGAAERAPRSASA